MNTRLPRTALAALGLVAMLLLGGCLEQVCVWSPDGQRAAVVNLDHRALHLCDATGQLSPALADGVTRVAWFGDSRQLVLARTHKEAKWTPIARALGQERAAAIVAAGEAAWQKLQAGAPWEGAGGVGSLFADRDREWKLVSLYLLERYGEALHAKLDAGRWDELQRRSVEVCDLVMARVDGDKLTLGTQLYEGVEAIADIRVSPDDKCVAFVTERAGGDSKDGWLWLVPANASTPLLVADRVAAYPDWTPDSRSLVYLQASGSDTDEVRLGTLVQREVRDTHGQVALKSPPSYLAGLLFSDHSRIRCLRDGRILFNATELQLPVSAADFGDEREQLFVFDPARQATLVRLIPRRQQDLVPKTLSFFDVSPDGTQVLFGDFNGNVAVLTLASGEVQRIQEGTQDIWQGEPKWRAPGEFTYTRRAALGKDGKPPARAAEIVLRSGKKETVLSATWPAEMVKELYSEKK